MVSRRAGSNFILNDHKFSKTRSQITGATSLFTIYKSLQQTVFKRARNLPYFCFYLAYLWALRVDSNDSQTVRRILPLCLVLIPHGLSCHPASRRSCWARQSHPLQRSWGMYLRFTIALDLGRDSGQLSFNDAGGSPSPSLPSQRLGSIAHSTIYELPPRHLALLAQPWIEYPETSYLDS